MVKKPWKSLLSLHQVIDSPASLFQFGLAISLQRRSSFFVSVVVARRSESIEKESGQWRSYPNVGRADSAIPTASPPEIDVSVDELRSSAGLSDVYPQSIHSALVGSPEPYANGS